MINAYSPYSYPARNNPGTNQRSSLRWFLYLIILAAGGFGLSFYFSSLGDQYSAEVISGNGGIEYREDSNADWREIEKFPLETKLSFEIRTLADGKAKIKSSEESQITMGGFARLVLLKNQGEISWAQTDGEVRYLIAENDKRKSYKVILSDGELEVLGTDFVVKVEEKDTTVYVFKGKVKTVYKDKSSQEAGENEKIIINPLEKKVIAFDEKDFSSSIREEDGAPTENPDKSISESISNNNQNVSESQLNGNLNENSSNTTEPTKNESILVGEDKNQNNNQNSTNSNINSSPSITSSAVKESTETTSTQTEKTTTSSSSSSTAKTANSGKTTRSKCEDSGGHWNKDSGLCKCPPGENFTGGKCKRQ